MNVARLFRVPQCSAPAIKYILFGLKAKFPSPDYNFGSEFDPKTGDHYVTATTYHVIPDCFLQKIINMIKD